MSCFGKMVLGSLAVLCSFLGCGDKDLQDYSPPIGGAMGTGGATTIVDSDAGSGGTGGIDGAGGTTGSSGPVYANDIDLLLKKYCTSCHSAGAIKPPVDTYATAKANASASNDTIIDGTMPPGPSKLTAAEKAHFDTWVKAGTPP
jgi:hypothetical protein